MEESNKFSESPSHEQKHLQFLELKLRISTIKQEIDLLVKQQADESSKGKKIEAIENRLIRLNKELIEHERKAALLQTQSAPTTFSLSQTSAHPDNKDQLLNYSSSFYKITSAIVADKKLGMNAILLNLIEGIDEETIKQFSKTRLAEIKHKLGFFQFLKLAMAAKDTNKISLEEIVRTDNIDIITSYIDGKFYNASFLQNIALNLVEPLTQRSGTASDVSESRKEIEQWHRDFVQAYTTRASFATTFPEAEYTAALFIALANNLSVADKLFDVMINQRCKFTVADADGNTLLHHCVKKKEYDRLDTLLKYMVTIDLKNQIGKTPYHLAAQENDELLIKLFIKYDANVLIQDDAGNTPLQYLIAADNSKMVEYIITNMKDINLSNASGKTIFHIAAEKNDVQLMNLCIKYHSRADLQDNLGNTPLHYLASNGQQELYETFANQGIGKSITNLQNKTAQTILEEFWQAQVEQLKLTARQIDTNYQKLFG